MAKSLWEIEKEFARKALPLVEELDHLRYIYSLKVASLAKTPEERRKYKEIFYERSRSGSSRS